MLHHQLTHTLVVVMGIGSEGDAVYSTRFKRGHRMALMNIHHHHFLGEAQP